MFITCEQLKCCGINSKDDWEHVFHNKTLPYTCCENTAKNEECSSSSENINNEGCLPKLKTILENKAYIVGSVGVGIGLIQVLVI